MKIAGFAFAIAAMMAGASPAFAQSAPIKLLSTASTNANLVVAGNVLLKSGYVGNTSAAAVFLKLYNKATQPVCDTDVPKWTIPVAVGGNAPLPLGDGLMFPLGLGICITGAIADNDTTVVAAGVAVNLGVTKR